MADLIELKVPDIGGSTDVNVAEIYVKVGDKISIDDDLIMLETDKATMEVPSTVAGIVKEVIVTVGSKINEGDLIFKVEVEGSSATVEAPAPVVAAPAKPAPIATEEPSSSGVSAAKKLMPIIVPDLSGNNNVGIIEINVQVGDTVNVEDTLITLETDKATMEVPATHSGVIKEIKVSLNDKVNHGDVILMLETSDTNATSSVAIPSSANTTEIISASAVSAPVAPPATTVPAVANSSQINEISFSKAFASPAIRKLARELGTDLGKIKGSGTKGRITEADLKSFIKEVMGSQNSASGVPTNGSGLDLLPWPKIDFAKFGEVDIKEMSRIKKISGANLSRNWIMIPHVTQFDDADITELEEFRKQINEEYKKAEIKVSPLAFIIKACVFALKKFPEFNASIDGDKIVYKKYYNIGFAADTPNGLVVPVLKDADKKGIVQLATESGALAKLARDGKLKPADMQGGTFTISSLGGIGGTAFTPIVNAPEVAILGISKSAIKPVWNGKEFIPRLIMPISLSYDHRIIDGALAAKFSTYLAQVLSDVRRLVL